MLFIFSCILLHLASLTIAQTNLLDHNCPNDVGNYTTNSDFQRNLNSALSSLDSNTQIDYGFYNLSVGQPGPDQANVIALCRGDIGVDECQNCIRNSSAKILQVCPKQKEAFGIADTCTLRYSNKSIFGVMEDNPLSILENTASATDVNQFNQGLQTLMTRLRSTAASGNSFLKFATGNETAGFDIIFGLVQCTPDLSELQCDNCLGGVIRVIGQLVGVSFLMNLFVILQVSLIMFRENRGEYFSEEGMKSSVSLELHRPHHNFQLRHRHNHHQFLLLLHQARRGTMHELSLS